MSFLGSRRRSSCVRLVLSVVAILFLDIFFFLMASASCQRNYILDSLCLRLF